MKKLLQLALIVFPGVFFLAGCSSFYHAHYSALDKVPATGIRSAPHRIYSDSPLHMGTIPNGNNVRTRRTSSPTPPAPDNPTKPKPTRKIHLPNAQKLEKIAAPAKRFIPVERTDRVRGHVSLLVLITILTEFFFGLFLVILGGVFIWGAFMSGRMFSALFGTLMILAGLPPVARMFRSLFHMRKKNPNVE